MQNRLFPSDRCIAVLCHARRQNFRAVRMKMRAHARAHGAAKMRNSSLQKLIEQKAAIDTAIRAARAAQHRAEKAARRRDIAALVERAIRAGATVAQIQAAIDTISAAQTGAADAGGQHV
jgi:hypothetical protein